MDAQRVILIHRVRGIAVSILVAFFVWSLGAAAWARESQGGKEQGGNSTASKGPGQGIIKGGKGGNGGQTGGKGAKESAGGELALSRPVLPDRYVLGPGDRLMINLWGEYDSFAEYQISAEGKVSLPTIGDLKVKGLTLAEAEVLLRTEVEKYYRNVRSGISLISLRSFVVSVLGAVKQPGNYKATLDHRASDLIDLAGGVLPGGSRRHIQVLQGGKVRAASDLSAFLRRGKLDDNPYLQDGDVIYVPPVRTPFVTIYDDASSPGEEGTLVLPITYELMEGQHFATVIYDLGGVNPAWDLDNVYIIRQTPGEDQARRIPVNLLQLVREQDGGNDLVMQSGDQLFFPVDLRRPFLNGLGELVGGAKNDRSGPNK